MSFVEVFFGWPSILASLIVALLGIAMSRWQLLVVSAVLISGFSSYLFYASLNAFALLGVAMPLLQLGSAFLVYRGAKALAYSCLLPQLLTTIYFGIAVLK